MLVFILAPNWFPFHVHDFQQQRHEIKENQDTSARRSFM
jgi:hypothetical protein